ASVRRGPAADRRCRGCRRRRSPGRTPGCRRSRWWSSASLRRDREVRLVAAVDLAGVLELGPLGDRVAVWGPVVAGVVVQPALDAGPAGLGERDAEVVVDGLQGGEVVGHQVLVLDVADPLGGDL